MRRSRPQSVCLKGLITAVLFGGAAASGQSKDKQVVLVYDEARVAPQVMNEALSQASRIFCQALVAVNWIDCHVVVAGGKVNDNCSQYLNSNPIFLHVLPTAGAFPNLRALGHAAVAPEGGVRATVYFDRVQKFTGENHPSCGLARLMGHVMAHELGHLLLSRASHSLIGLMAGPWDLKQLVQAEQGTLLFTPEEGVSMREAVTRRARRPPVTGRFE
jgi:hypothetical protein